MSELSSDTPVVHTDEKLADKPTISVTAENIDVSTPPSTPPSNHKTTSTYIHNDEFVHGAKYEFDFPWKKIGSFLDNENTVVSNEEIKLNNKTASIINKYIYEKYYADFYWNTCIVVLSCFAAYVLMLIGYGLFGYIFVSICTFAVYRTEFRRFAINIRDDMQRIQSSEALENKLESIDWLNNFLAKFWVIYMPALSDLVITNSNQILLDVSPPPPINKLTLDEFTLGTKAPKIESIKSFTKLGKNVYQMDWNVNFTPNDISDMTQNELRNKIDPKIALGIRIGKGFVGVSLPVLVEDMTFVGNMRVKVVIGDLFPHIDIVSVCFMEPPTIDYALKPVGGNTLGIDVMSVIPGLSSFVKNLINSNLAPLMYYPNTIDVNPNDFIQKPSAIGCLAVKIRGAQYISSKNINPYIQYGVEGDFKFQYKTDIKFQTVTPIFNEVQFILNNNINSKLKLELFELKSSGQSKSLCEASFELQDLLQDPVMDFVETKLIKQNKNLGKVVYDLKWYPVVQPETLGDGLIINQFDSEIGILNLNILTALELDTSSSMIGKLSTYIELYLDNKLIEKSRIIKGNNNPEYNFQFESLVLHKSVSILKIVIKDISSFEETAIATYEAKLLDVLYLEPNDVKHDSKDQHKKASQIIRNFTTGKGKIKFTSEWKPLGPITEIEEQLNDISFVPPMGVFKIGVKQCRNLMQLEDLGKLNTFITISTHNKVKGITTIVWNDKNPVYDDEFFVSIYSKNQKITVSCYDTDQRGNDEKLVGQTIIDVNEFFANEETNKLIDITRQLKKNGKKTGEIDVSLTYYPLIKLFSHQEVIQINEKASDKDLINNDLDELEEQAKFLEDYKKHPDDYEWVDVLDENGLNKMLELNDDKVIMSLDDLLKFNSGVLGINLIDGTLESKNGYVEFFIDDHSYPDFISRKVKNHKVNATSGDCFIRDLRNSILNIRITKTISPKYQSDILYETVDSFNVIELLKNGYDKPVELKLDDNKLSVVFEFVPTVDNSSNLFDSVENTGLLKICVKSASDLLIADRGGKSDPFVVGHLNNKQVFKTKIKKKTLNPIWDETFSIPVKSRKKDKLILEAIDWDMTGDNDPLGNVIIDLSQIEPNKPIKDDFRLSTQGSINLELLFTPGYLKPNSAELASHEEPSPFGYRPTISDFTSGAAIVTNHIGATSEIVNDVTGIATGAADTFKKFVPHNKNESSGHFTLKPPTFGHRKKSSIDSTNTFGGSSQFSHRTSSDMTSVRTNAFNGTGAIPGRVTLVEFFPEVDFSEPLSFKVALQSGNGSLKTLYKTKKYKVEDGEIKIAESFTFKCDASTKIVFSLKNVHHFGKSEEVGSGMILLQDAAGKKENLQVPIIGKVTGTLVVNFNYA
ncbi:hypothetical protein CANINC_004741 [Pichia inconspicua]|uniref:C2 domain-containing protein n=1 Tax=Pichia inconspicua TaxID=52247 RepID=A0A4T0WWJ7_9ASCO|nr:hypothetical protein CANINC_004741 [[Candida] inconspicua]